MRPVALDRTAELVRFALSPCAVRRQSVKECIEPIYILLRQCSAHLDRPTSAMAMMSSSAFDVSRYTMLSFAPGPDVGEGGFEQLLLGSVANAAG